MRRKYPIGAEVSKGGVDFRIWAPDNKKANVVIENANQEVQIFALKRDKRGYFSAFIPGIGRETLYRFQLGNSDQKLPDPASRYQPVGVHGPSSVVDPKFSWTDDAWIGMSAENAIIYEMHIGTFTSKGTFSEAAKELPALADLGITVIELMPINEFPGQFGWGYDGVLLFAPYHIYGSPNSVKSFINQAHALGIGVILDVVYNHFGPEGNFSRNFTTKYTNPKKTTDWGEAINFDEPSVCEFFLTNARYWIEEFHFDGLRVDATPWFFCETPEHILATLTKEIRRARPKHKKIIIGENEQQKAKLLQPYSQGGYQFDALWNDDFHHSAVVRLKGKREAYYTDYLGSPQEFISAAKYGFLYQGQFYDWQKQNRGTPDLTLPHSSMVVFLENHDQIANSGNGKRIHQLCDPGNYKALNCLVLLGPNIPMIFQGQEFASSAPFYYFADHSEDLNQLIHQGRKKELSQFPRLATKEMRQILQKPFDPMTFTQCKLDFTERERNAECYAFFKDLIHLRREDPVFQAMLQVRVDGAVLGTDSFLLRYFGGELGDRLLIFNFGPDYYFNPAPEPLLVAGENKEWKVLWSSESWTYGGEGTPPINIPYWKILGHSAIVLKD